MGGHLDKSNDDAFRRAAAGADELRTWTAFTCEFASLEGSSVYAIHRRWSLAHQPFILYLNAMFSRRALDLERLQGPRCSRRLAHVTPGRFERRESSQGYANSLLSLPDLPLRVRGQGEQASRQRVQRCDDREARGRDLFSSSTRPCAPN